MEIELSEMDCRKCDTSLKLSSEQKGSYLKMLGGWSIEGESIRKEFAFRDFSGSMAFVNKIAEIAESQNHHPDITIRWNKVGLILTTHSQKSLTMNDFIMAAKIDAIK